MVTNLSTYMYKKTDDCSIYLDFYSSNKKNSPVIIYTHGGALIWGSRKNINPKQVDLYNEAGYSVISLDHRLAPETKLKHIVEDINDAIVWVKENGEDLLGIDNNRIAMVGSSAGGYLSLLSGTFDVKPNAIVSFYGYGDVLGEWYGKPSEHYCKMPLVNKNEAYEVVGNEPITQGDRERFIYYLYCRQKGIWTKEVSGYHTLFQKEKIIPFCPIYNVSSDFPPTLLIHGDVDTDVPYEQSVNMSEKLEEYGVYNKLITVKNEGHVFDNDMKKPVTIEVFNQVLNFLKMKLQ
ncbi:alpha/beta hydrolase [Proteiniborus sp. MB09-C3]|uniref:alpha/beta hydrolase n=1 Tax=Proteiniborus sp. MB09-C3 TaxID=3050072 RepID=UPI002556E872|nr:alpha/beta hydrolase [Proteiniborus sp. MB09-C3]WIV12669.1 alpha/beta hydrolase [Proteiniborus sp. MB09-C3]